MPVIRKIKFFAITTKGALFPIDFLGRLAAGDKNIEGLTSESYHLDSKDKINEAISRSWNNILGYWKNFQASIEKLTPAERGTSETREKWLLPLFKELGYGRLLASETFHFDGKDYPISHLWNKSPIHLISFKAPLDEKSDIIGARKTSPHAMLQDFLNRSENHQWGFLSNGYELRILRDNRSLTKQAYIEFDLKTIFETEVYSDFVILWLLCHQSRIEAERAELCWLEKWTKASREQGIRALESMRNSVEKAIAELGIGFIENKHNSELRSKLQDGHVTVQDYYRQLLRIVYRLLFLFAAEDRELLHVPGASLESKQIYIKYYSTSHIREIAQRSKGTSHIDLWELITFIFEKLGSDEGCKELALPAWGSFLWQKESIADLAGCKLTNRSLLNVIRSLAFTIEEQILRPVDYKNLGAEELGSVYEALLELHPKITIDPAGFSFENLSGSERKTTGSYYTPDTLVQSLLETALEPVLNEALKQENPEQAILSLKICDPAMGSGHFLIAAAHRVAKKLAAIRTGDDEPSPIALQHALRDVISNCIYGVDINPMAVELCKFSLWLEALEPGMPLSFLDHHIKCGNSLLGTTPALMREGIPNEAFKPIEGDDKNYCSEWKKVNRKERETRTDDMFRYSDEPWKTLGNLAINITQIIDIPNNSIENIHRKEKRYAELVNSQGYEFGKLLADTWCTSFVWKKTKNFAYPITEEVFRKIEHTPHSTPDWMRDEIKRLSSQYQFFHWHLEFPEVFRVLNHSKTDEEVLLNEHAGWNGGFDVVLGNPPWEKVKLQEKKWFIERKPEIATAGTAAQRKKMIFELEKNDPTLYNAFMWDVRKAEGESHFYRNSGFFPLSCKGDINTYAIFSELFNSLNKIEGRAGFIVPTGIATDDSLKIFFSYLVENNRIFSLIGFINTKKIFTDIKDYIKFCLLTLGPSGEAVYMFLLTEVSQISDDKRRFFLTKEDFRLLNPNTLTCPIFRTNHDAELTKKIYRGTSILSDESKNINPWCIEFYRMLDMTNESEQFQEIPTDTSLKLYEAKMIWNYDHRFATYENATQQNINEGNLPQFNATMHQDAHHYIQPRYWLETSYINSKLSEWDKRWFLVCRGIASITNERVSISSIIPFSAVSNSAPIIRFKSQKAIDASCLLACLNSYVMDYILRQKLGGPNLNFFILKQLAILSPKLFTISELNFILPRVLELIYTAIDIEQFVLDMINELKNYSLIIPSLEGYYINRAKPFIWSEERRFLLKAELDAFIAHLFELEIIDLKYILDPQSIYGEDFPSETFRIMKNREIKEYGEFKTARTIVEIFQDMSECKKNGTQYQTKLDPPPADPKVAHKGL